MIPVDNTILAFQAVDGATYFVQPQQLKPVPMAVPMDPEPVPQYWPAPQPQYYMVPAPGQYMVPSGDEMGAYCAYPNAVPMQQMSSSPVYSEGYADSFYTNSYAPSTYAPSSYQESMSSRASTPLSIATTCTQSSESLSTRFVNLFVFFLCAVTYDLSLCFACGQLRLPVCPI